MFCAFTSESTSAKFMKESKSVSDGFLLSNFSTEEVDGDLRAIQFEIELNNGLGGIYKSFTRISWQQRDSSTEVTGICAATQKCAQIS